MTTSQNATAPKPRKRPRRSESRLTTSQNATAPKRFRMGIVARYGLTTSQNATAPKQLTVITESPHHAVTDVLKKKKYELTRTSKATKENADKFLSDFKANELSVRRDTEIEMWESEYAPYGLAFDAAGRRKALLVVKSEMHEWLKKNAKAYGYVYSFGRAK